jgi:hypothetical protein
MPTGSRSIEGITTRGDRVLLLAGPTMTLAGPCLIHRWPGAFRHDPPTLNQPPALTVHSPAPLLWIRDGARGASHNKPEGLDRECRLGDLIAWVVDDNPDNHRCRGDGCGTRLDGFVMPGDDGD